MSTNNGFETLDTSDLMLTQTISNGNPIPEVIDINQTTQSFNKGDTTTNQDEKGVVKAVEESNQQHSVSRPMTNLASSVFLEIIEQPAANKLRFRFASESPSGSLPGKRSTDKQKTFPTIRIHGYNGPAEVRVSCVEHNALPNTNSYRVHPHKIVGDKNECYKDFGRKSVNTDSMECEFKTLGIQCVKRADIEASLNDRQKNGIDPFGTGFRHKEENFNLNKIRLAFQVFLRPQGSDDSLIAVKDIAVSEVILDRKRYGDLKIKDWSANISPFKGGKKIILLVENISRDDIEVHFKYLDPKDGSQNTLKGIFSQDDIHHKFGIALTTPVFPNLSVKSIVEAQMYLSKKSDARFVSNMVEFFFCPHEMEEKIPESASAGVASTSRPTKRDRDAIKTSEESSGRIAAPPQRFKSGDSAKSNTDTEKDDDSDEEPKMSTMILNDDHEGIKAFIAAHLPKDTLQDLTETYENDSLDGIASSINEQLKMGLVPSPDSSPTVPTADPDKQYYDDFMPLEHSSPYSSWCEL